MAYSLNFWADEVVTRGFIPVYPILEAFLLSVVVLKKWSCVDIALLWTDGLSLLYVLHHSWFE